MYALHCRRPPVPAPRLSAHTWLLPPHLLLPDALRLPAIVAPRHLQRALPQLLQLSIVARPAAAAAAAAVVEVLAPPCMVRHACMHEPEGRRVGQHWCWCFLLASFTCAGKVQGVQGCRAASGSDHASSHVEGCRRAACLPGLSLHVLLYAQGMSCVGCSRRSMAAVMATSRASTSSASTQVTPLPTCHQQSPASHG
jgi:hypothetical protein